MMRILLLVLAGLMCMHPLLAQHRITIRGTVIDSTTKLPIRFATVRIDGTTTGTFSSRDGGYLLRGIAVPDTIRIVASMVGYDPLTIVLPARDTTVDLLLSERQLRTAPIVVRAEDPAVGIMRQVLARKSRQTDSLKRYTYMLYSKFVAITDTLTASRSTSTSDSTVFSILESFSKGYVAVPDKYFNEIIQRRQTANIPPQANFVAFGTNLNAYDEVVTIIGQEIPTPFAQDALDNYRFRLDSDERDSLVRIEIEPSSSLRRGFTGQIFIDTKTMTPLEVRLRPNRAVNLPFDAKLSYRQTFRLVDGWAVMPETMHIASSLTADVLFVLSPRLDISIETYCYDYDLGAAFDDGVFDQRRVEITRQAERFDESYWQQNAKVALRPEEAAAYEEIRIALENPDSLLTNTLFDRYFGEVNRVLRRLNRRPFTGFEDIVRYNRVHGLYTGLGMRFRPDTALELAPTLGYGFADRRAYGSLSATVFMGEFQQWTIDATLRHSLARRDDPYSVRTALITATSFMSGIDYGDYYYATGWEGGIGYSWGQLRFIRNDVYERPSRLRLFVRDERQTTARQHDVFSVFRPDQPRINPSIIDASVRSIGGELFLSYNPQRLVARTGIGVRAEMSDPAILPTDLSFRRFDVHARLRTPTLPLWTLDVDLRAGLADGNVPPQKFFSLESSIAGLATPGTFRGMRVKEFYGDRFVALTLAHNFGEVVPGVLRIPNIASLGLEFILTSSLAWTAFSEKTRSYTATMLPALDVTAGGFYAEYGLAINRILLFLRLDVTARVTQRTSPQFYVTLSTATF
ncbi:MAG: carboxypeptidase-like regulatory domain-containing protein [Candidatus Kapabacteria bacterium]|nr:carboxypeptidase-like regulatory domain-containing protein [Candidatus Kapabacteria bacterium]